MTHPTEERRAELRAKAEAATQGQWELQDGSSWRRIGVRGEQDGNVLCPCNPSSDRHPDLCAGRGESIYDNLRFIVAAQPATVIELLDHITALEAALAWALGELDDWDVAEPDKYRRAAALLPGEGNA